MFHVKIEKIYAIYKIEELGGHIDDNNFLAKFPVKWVMKRNGDWRWEGRLSIPKPVEFTDLANVNEKKDLLHILSHPTSHYNPASS